MTRDIAKLATPMMTFCSASNDPLRDKGNVAEARDDDHRYSYISSKVFEELDNVSRGLLCEIT